MGARFAAMLTWGLIGLLVAAAPAGARHARAACVPGHPFLLAANERAQVFVRHPGYIPEIGGCVYGQHRTVPLGRAFEEPPAIGYGAGNRHYTLTGTTVAYEEVGPPYTPRSLTESLPSFTLVIRDLATGRVLHRVPTGVPPTPAATGLVMPAVGIGAVEDLALRPDGSAAWIASELVRPGHFEVMAVDRDGVRELASGSTIESSLVLVGNFVYWTDNGRSHHATLR
jgi:hypothetical protein